MTEEKKRRGPKPKHLTKPDEYHLKFSGKRAEWIKQQARQKDYQTYFDELVDRDKAQQENESTDGRTQVEHPAE